MLNFTRIKSNKQFSNLVIYGIGQGFNLVTPLLVAPYLVYVCGVDGYGKIGTAMAISFFLIVMVDYGIDITGVKDISVNRHNKAKLEEIMSTAYVSRFLLLTGILAIASFLFYIVPFFSNEKMLYFLSLPIVIGQFINPTWILQGIENFSWITILNILSKILYAAGVFIVIHDSGDYIYSNLLWGAGTITANLISLIYLRSKYNISLRNTSKEKVAGYIKANFSLSFSQLFVSAQLYFPIVLINFMGGGIMAGIFRIVEQIVGMFKTYIILFSNYVYPKVCYLLEVNLKAGMRFWKQYNGANFIFVAIAMGTLYVMAVPVVAYFGPKNPDEVAKLLRLAVPLPVMLTISMPLRQLLLGWDHQKLYVRLTMALVVFNGLLMAALLHFYGISGVFASLIITEGITALLYMYGIREKLFGTAQTV
ncbi:oligosaccharide flippase family protein [Flavobacterium sp. DG1-102-2]|uniref:oligosaccharide flippase family protein n=1 Tax=Flavobacterium sp. DG1-102-2 TaxID=3081663 RepID=UPI002949C72F|nr:oligosaccharide flippase family protein [Flavobacterium sp. DG1-102-2]MDV6167730.1 oligosaccharide flippase family protein [Flavobacterium sp. DG1-102-2]